MAKVRGEERKISSRVLYDLQSDPGELRGRSWQGSSSGSERLLDLIRDDPDPAGIPKEYRSGIRLSAPKVAPGVTPEQLEALRQLGYAE